MLSLWHVVKHVIQWKLLWHKHECETCCETECETCCETCSLNARHVVKLNARIQWKLLCHKHDVSIVLSRNLTWSRAVDCYISSLCSHSMETVTAETRRQHCVWQKYGIALVQWTVVRCVSARIQRKLLWQTHNIANTTHNIANTTLVLLNQQSPNFQQQLQIWLLYSNHWIVSFECKSNHLIIWIWLQKQSIGGLDLIAIIWLFEFDCKSNHLEVWIWLQMSFFHWKCYIPETHQIEIIRLLSISLYKF